MTRDSKRRCLQMISACAVCAMAITPGFAQTTTYPSSTPQSRPSTGTDAQSTPRGMEDRTGVTPRSNEHGMKHGNGMQKDATQVRRVQEQLKAEGHDPGPIDGVMGPKTKAALKEFQRQENLQETGRIDAQTLEKLGIS
jgi:His-Xaa-Ser repeat protein HxsA